MSAHPITRRRDCLKRITEEIGYQSFLHTNTNEVAASIPIRVICAREETANLVNGLLERRTNESNLEQGKMAISINHKTGKPMTVDEIEKGIGAASALAEKLFVTMNRWFKASTVLYVICHVFLLAGFALLIWAKSKS